MKIITPYTMTKYQALVSAFAAVGSEGIRSRLILPNMAYGVHLLCEIGLMELIPDWELLKNVERAGWVARGVRDPESVAEHSVKVAQLALSLGMDTRLDIRRIISMGVVHDISEARVGDIMPGQLPEDEKHALEEEAIESIMRDVRKGRLYRDLFLEYNGKETDEAQFVGQVDKLEMINTALRYQRRYPELSGVFDGMWAFTRRKLTIERLIREFEILERMKLEL